MVIHNPEQQRALSARQEKQRQKAKPAKTATGGWSVLTVQSLACAVLLFLVVLFRMAGGAAYEELRQGFRTALMKNEWVTALARLWDGEVELSVDEAGQTVVKTSAFTPGESLHSSGSDVTSHIGDSGV